MQSDELEGFSVTQYRCKPPPKESPGENRFRPPRFGSHSCYAATSAGLGCKVTEGLASRVLGVWGLPDVTSDQFDALYGHPIPSGVSLESRRKFDAAIVRIFLFIVTPDMLGNLGADEEDPPDDDLLFAPVWLFPGDSLSVYTE